MRLRLDDFARSARTRLAPAVWNFFEGGAGEERTLAANVEAFDRVWLRPLVLRGADRPDITTTILGHSWDAPVAVAPLAYQTLAHSLGELATVRGSAAAARVPFRVAVRLSGREGSDA